jgi:hypothetical protein
MVVSFFFSYNLNEINICWKFLKMNVMKKEEGSCGLNNVISWIKFENIDSLAVRIFNIWTNKKKCVFLGK